MRAPVFAINLERSPERRAAALEAYRAVGVNLQIHKAVDGRAGDLLADPRYDRATRLARYGVDLTSTEIACYLSHITLMEFALREGLERIVIIEDDVHPGPGFAPALDWLSDAPASFECVRFMGLRPRPASKVCAINEGMDLVWPHHGLCGAQAYYVTRTAMEKLVTHGLPITLPYDMMLDRFWRTGLTIFAIEPYAAKLAETASDIGSRLDAWDERPRPWLRARLKLRKLWERGERTIANADRRARLPEWRRQAQAAFGA